LFVFLRAPFEMQVGWLYSECINSFIIVRLPRLPSTRSQCRWIYRVDNTRVNEFGFSAEKPPEDAAGVGGVVNEITDGAAVAEEELVTAAGGDDGGVEPSSLRRRGAAVGVSGEKLTSGVGSISGQQEQQRAGDSGDEGAGVEDSAHEKAS
jgi:hypothetical protein